MQSLNLFLTRHTICYQSTDLSIDETILPFDEPAPDPFVQLEELLSELSLPRNTTINLILDHCFVSLYCFALPPVSKRRIDKLLNFELADTLLAEVEDYSYDYQPAIVKGEKTNVNVYLAKKETVGRVVQICKTYGLEARNILSAVDLINLKLQKRYQPDNQIFVVSDRYYTYLYTYKKGVLQGVSSLKVPDHFHIEDPGEEPNPYLDNLNSKLRSIAVAHNQINDVRIYPAIDSFLRTTEQLELAIGEKPSVDMLPESHFSLIAETPLLSLPKKINLLKSNVFLLKEIRKYTKRILFTAIIFGLCGVIYLGTLIYGNIINTIEYKELENHYSKTVDKYLPKGTSKSNAIYVLQQQVNELEKQKKINQRFVKRSYSVTKQLSDLSALKSSVKSLRLTRYHLTDQLIRVQGEVSSYVEYDKLKANLESIYPDKEYALKYSQKSIGEGLIRFTVTARVMKK